MRSCASVCGEIAGWRVTPAKIEAAVEGVNDGSNRTAAVAGVYGHLSLTMLRSEPRVAPSEGIAHWCLPALRQQTGKAASAMRG